jgi:hypothetical protein
MSAEGMRMTLAQMHVVTSHRDLPRPVLVACLWERVQVVRAVGHRGPVRLGCVPELIEHAQPYMKDPLVRSLVNELVDVS